MNEEFWQERWERGQTGFHQQEVDEDLRRFWRDVAPTADTTVLVPLCGKTRSMMWLREQSHRVLGVELSRLAVSEFFAENDLEPVWEVDGPFESAEEGGIRVLCGNILDLTAAHVTNVTAVFDRAALIALPEEMRQRYAQHLARILKPGTRMLLVTLDYSQTEMAGPPFSVSPAEVQRLYGEYADVDLLTQRDVLQENAHLAARGLTSLDSCVFRVTLRS